MGRYFKNWRGCYIGKKRLNRGNLLLTMMILVLMSSFLFLNYLDKRFKKITISFLNEEAERLTTNLVNKALNEVDVSELSSLLIIKKNNNGMIENISYDTVLLNKLSNEFSDKIQEKLVQLERGLLDDSYLLEKVKASRYHHIKDGVFCEVSFGALRESSLFSNIGPVIPVRLLFLGQVMPDFDIKVKEYGINNLMIEIYFIAKVKEQITMPFSSVRKEIIVNQLIAVDIIRGEIPSYYHGFSK